ncbi:MAG: UDP-N-acetylmuramoyl-L-alanyl-D-glutamate--2,6-diaminopimelate ligase [bacterium]
MMSLAELVDEIRGCVVDGNPLIEVAGIAYDSRKVSPGDLFVAIKGFKTDGHDYVHDAVRRGAVAAIVERDVEVPLEFCKVMVPDSRAALSHISSAYYGDPSREIEITGVTGTNGKTTTCYLLRSIYQTAGMDTAMLTTIEYWIGRRRREAELTTPESLDVHRILRKMAESGIRALAMEVSSHGLALKRVRDVDFAKGVFTNLSRDHLDFHGDMQEYLSSKRLLFENIQIGGIAALNCDDENWKVMASATQAKVVKFGFSEGADFRATEVRATLDGTEVEVNWMEETARIKSPLVGRHNVYNMIASAATAAYSGLDKGSIVDGIKKVKRIPGRLEPFDLPSGARAFVDYAHTPDALERVLSSLKEVTDGSVVCVFGCGGDRDRGKRPIMGEVSTRLADYTIITTDNPRSEGEENIIDDISKDLRRDNFGIEVDRRKAIEKAVAMVKRGDCVLIAGKGHERFQIVGNTRIPFDDREVISSLIGKKN